MDHLRISDTVNSTGAFRVAGVATPVILFGFLSLVRGKATEKIDYKNFRSFCSLGLYFNVLSIFTESKDCLFLDMR